MKLKITSSQYKLLSRYCEDLSKAIMLYNIVGYFLPSVLSSLNKPSIGEFIVGLVAALTLLFISIILINRGGNK